MTTLEKISAIQQEITALADRQAASIDPKENETLAAIQKIAGGNDPIANFFEQEPEAKAFVDKFVAMLVSEGLPVFRRPRTLMRAIQTAKQMGIS